MAHGAACPILCINTPRLMNLKNLAPLPPLLKHSGCSLANFVDFYCLTGLVYEEYVSLKQ